MMTRRSTHEDRQQKNFCRLSYVCVCVCVPVSGQLANEMTFDLDI